MSVLLILLLLHSVHSQEEEDKFVATNEWKQIKEGQSIPKGLHVRMDLTTGIREAKLMSEEEASTQGESNRVTLHEDSIVDVGVVDGDNLNEEALKKIVYSNDSSSTVSGRFRSMEELKKSMPDMAVNTEGHVLRNTMKALYDADTEDVPNLLILLEDLEDQVHKYDNGKLLVTQGWMGRIAEQLDHAEEEVLKATLRVITSAAQSNPTVQAHCIEQGYLATLISKLLTQPEKLAKSTVFTISAIVRNLPSGLDAFASLHGFNTISTKLALSSHGPLQRVILTLYNDLLRQSQVSGDDKVLSALSVASNMLCKKTDNLISDPNSPSDVLEESIVFYSAIKHLCSNEINNNVTTRLKIIQEGLVSVEGEEDIKKALLLALN